MKLDQTEIRKTLDILFAPGDVFEIRVLGPSVLSATFDDAELAILWLKKMGIYSNVYVTMNPLSPGATGPAKNTDIARRNWLLIDIDPEREANTMATDFQKDLARALSERVKIALNWPPPIVLNSGNGYHLLYRVDLPTEDGQLVKRCLHALASRYNMPAVKIDTSVSNAARIIRLPGTWNCKGDNPSLYRRGSIVHVPQALGIVPQSTLEALGGKTGTNTSTSTPKAATAPEPYISTRLGDEYNQRGNLPALLEAHGWQLIGQSGLNQLWRRPGKLSGGQSATFDGRHFYVFSGNAQPFEPNQSYTPFAAFAILAHRGDYKAAANALSSQGYGAAAYSLPPAAEVIEPPKPKPSFAEKPAPLDDRYADPPGLLGHVMAFNLDTAPKPQPILALAGAIALQAVLCARKITDTYDTRPNIYVCGVAESGAGKDHARQINKQILMQAGLSHLQAEGLKSGSALINALVVQPSILFQIDEYGRFIKASANQNTSPHLHEITTKLLSLYSNSNTTFESDRYADTERGGQRILEPHAILYGTTVPRSLYDGLTEESLNNGFLGRTLIFDVENHNPVRQLIRPVPIPPHILDIARYWGNLNPGGGNLAPEPIVAPVTDRATKYMSDFTELEHEEQGKLKASEIAVLWTRTAQNGNKLALIYAASRDPERPEIDYEAVRWGYDLATWLTRRMAYIIADNVSDNQFHGLCLKVKRAIRKNEGSMSRRDIMRAMRIPARQLDDVISAMLESEDIEIQTLLTGGRPRVEYSVTG